MKSYGQIINKEDLVNKGYVDSKISGISLASSTENMPINNRNCLVTLPASDNLGRFGVSFSGTFSVYQKLDVYIKPGKNTQDPKASLTFHIDVPNTINNYPVFLNGTTGGTPSTTRRITISRNSEEVKSSTFRIFFDGEFFYIDTTINNITSSKTV